MLSSQNINLSNVCNTIKHRWLGLFLIIEVNYLRNNYTLDLSSHAELHHINKSFHIGVLKLYHANNHQEVLQHYYSEPGLVKDYRYEVEKALKCMFSHSARERLYHTRWISYLPCQDQWIHSDAIDEEVKFRFWQEEDLKPTFQRSRCHRGRPGPRTRRETLCEM